MKKAINALIALIVILGVAVWGTIIFFVCIRLTNFNNNPSQQGIDQWMSEDGNVFFKTDKNGYTYGYIKANDEVIPIQFTFSPGSCIQINGFTSEGATIETEYEQWSASYLRKNSFTAQVSDSVFFNNGEKIKFHKLKDDEKIDYEPLSFQSEKGKIAYENTVDKNADLLIPIINESILGKDVQYEAHIIALSMSFLGIKEITAAEILSIEDGTMYLYAVDAEGTDYRVAYSLSERMVYDVDQSNLENIEYSENIEYITHNFKELQTVEHVYFKSELEESNVRIGSSTFSIVGFIKISEDEKNSICETYDFVADEPYFPKGISPDITG